MTQLPTDDDGVRVTSFVVLPAASQLVAKARSTVHAFTYRAPLTGAIDVAVTEECFDLSTPITGRLEIDLEELKGDDPHTDSEMHRRLDTQRYPRARAAITTVVANGGDSYHLTGTLSLHGRTRPLEGNATVTLIDDKIHAVGAITVDVRDYEIKPPSLVILRVNPEIAIEIAVVAALPTA